MVESIVHTACSEFRRSETDSPTFGGLRKDHAAYEMQYETCCSIGSCFSWLECSFTARVWHLSSFLWFLHISAAWIWLWESRDTEEGAASHTTCICQGHFRVIQVVPEYQWKFTHPRVQMDCSEDIPAVMMSPMVSIGGFPSQPKISVVSRPSFIAWLSTSCTETSMVSTGPRTVGTTPLGFLLCSVDLTPQCWWLRRAWSLLLPLDGCKDHSATRRVKKRIETRWDPSNLERSRMLE